MKTLGILHTSFALVEPLGAWAKRELPGVRVVNIVDDTLLADARERGVDDNLKSRIALLLQAAEGAGADVILNACSSVSEAIDDVSTRIAAPVLKIDLPMAQMAAQRARRIAVLATVPSTLGPTCRLLQKQATAALIETTPILCDGAFDALVAGKTAEHDEAVEHAAREAAKSHDAIVLAQASMARLHERLENQVGIPVFSSPRPAFETLAQMLREN